MRADQRRQRLGVAPTSALRKRPAPVQLVGVGRAREQLDRTLVGLLLLERVAAEDELRHRLLVADEHLVAEGVLGIELVAAEHVAELVGQHHRQARLVGQHVDHPAAEHDRVTDRERLERRRHQHARPNRRLDHQVVGDLEVGEHRLQHLADLAVGGASSPARSRRRSTLSSASRTQARSPSTGETWPGVSLSSSAIGASIITLAKASSALIPVIS